MVIAIIAILAAILFPVFAQARAKARQVSCLSNIRQMDMATLLYAQDFDERFPLAATATPTGFLNWHHLVDPYVKNKHVWVCPDADIPLTNSFGSLICHYGFNTFYLNVGAVPANLFSLNNASGISLAAPQEPAQTLLMADTRGIEGKLPANHSSVYLLPPSQPDADFWGRPDVRHQSGVNIGFLDGHVKWMKNDAFYRSQTPSDAWFDLH